MKQMSIAVSASSGEIVAHTSFTGIIHEKDLLQQVSGRGPDDGVDGP
jgi:hypothetical protein